MDLTSIDHLLTTTRSVRKRLDLERPVDLPVIQECIELAIQAPDGGNLGKYHFLVVTDPEKRAAIASYYRKSFDAYLAARKENYANRIYDSAAYLAEHFAEVPVHIIPDVGHAVYVEAPTPVIMTLKRFFEGTDDK